MHLQPIKTQFPEAAAHIEVLERKGFHHRSAAWLENLDTDLAITACWLLGKSGDPEDADLLLAVLSGSRQELWMQAATDLSLIAASKHLDAMMALLDSDSNPQRREAVLYGLSFAFSADTAVATRLAQTFIQVAGQPTEVPLVRAQAFEGIANHLGVTDIEVDLLPACLYDQAAAVILRCLDDNEAEVRFWACFAAGQLQLSQAVPQLQQLAHDDAATAQDFWTVSEEAENAMTLIQGDGLLEPCHTASN